MIAMLVGTCLHVPLCFLFIKYFELGIVGLPIASSCKDFLILSTVMIYGNCSDQIRPALYYPDKTSFMGWGQYLKVSIPSTIMICAEMWGLNILTIIAGTLGVAE